MGKKGKRKGEKMQVNKQAETENKKKIKIKDRKANLNEKVQSK